MYSADEITRYIINRYMDLHKPIDNLKLQKILFYCQKEYVQETNELLFDDSIQVTDYGFMIPSIYYEFRSWGCLNITDYQDGIDLDIFTKQIVNYIMDKYKDTLTWYLVRDNHEEQLWKDLYIKGECVYVTEGNLLKYYREKES